MNSGIEKNIGGHHWQGRDDTAGEGASALRWHQQVLPYVSASAAGNVLIGFCSDEGVRRNGGRIGAAQGPAACRNALANLAWHGTRPVYDAGDVVCHGENLEAAQSALGKQIAALINDGQRPLVIGGGHEVAWGTWQGVALAIPQKNNHRIGIINVDAHFDLRQSAAPSSGTAFLQMADDCARRQWPFHYLCLGISALANTAALFATARRTGSQWLLDEEFVAWRHAEMQTCLSTFLDQVDDVYLTICLDAFPAAVAPGVSAPAARGIEVSMVEWVIDLVQQRGQLLVAEIAELNPRFDEDNRTARLAARLLARCAGAARPADFSQSTTE